MKIVNYIASFIILDGANKENFIEKFSDLQKDNIIFWKYKFIDNISTDFFGNKVENTPQDKYFLECSFSIEYENISSQLNFVDKITKLATLCNLEFLKIVRCSNNEKHKPFDFEILNNSTKYKSSFGFTSHISKDELGYKITINHYEVIPFFYLFLYQKLQITDNEFVRILSKINVFELKDFKKVLDFIHYLISKAYNNKFENITESKKYNEIFKFFVENANTKEI